MNDNPRSEYQRAGEWLAAETEIRVSRKVLVIGGIVLLVLLGIALD